MVKSYLYYSPELDQIFHWFQFTDLLPEIFDADVFPYNHERTFELYLIGEL